MVGPTPFGSAGPMLARSGRRRIRDTRRAGGAGQRDDGPVDSTLPGDITRDEVDRALGGAPAPGSTAIERWAWLAERGAQDLCLGKLVEPHLDATGILRDLGHDEPAPGSVWAVWAAEPPGLVLGATRDGDGWTLEGTKAFCSGWAVASHALVTANDDGTSRLFAIDLGDARDRGLVQPTGPAWVGTGMRRAGTATLSVRGVRAEPVGEPGDYTGRIRFWDGAIGVAAVWWGGARGVARTLAETGRRRPLGDHALAHLGAVTSVLDRTWAHLAEAARAVDAGDGELQARRALAESVRAGVAAGVDEVVARVDRALGPGPLALDGPHATRVDDLRTFVRQHHAEKDLAALGALVVDGHGRTL